MNTTRRGNELNAEDRKYVLAAYIYRQTIENAKTNPVQVRRAGSKLALIPDEQWLAVTRFEVLPSGRLNPRYKQCWTRHDEVPEHKAAIEAWTSRGLENIRA